MKSTSPEQLARQTIDFIVIDECHRSIYNLRRQVLEYFDAYLIGLIATPTMQALGFFNRNLVQDYNHAKAVTDGVNVGYDVYRIETKVTKDGATLVKEPGSFVPCRDRRTKKKKYEELDGDVTYTASQLDKDVVNKQQIQLVIQTFRDRLPEIFPGREDVPKTLIFAKTDLHADDIVEIVREEFGRGNDFCQKITAKNHKPDDMLNQFRNSFNPRIAVTVDMIATGTDVKPLECLIFMRNITSTSYFEQMKGRSCRIIDPDSLRMVTPDARSKTHFAIVDAVGVCKRAKPATQSQERKPYVSLDDLLKLVGAGAANADLVSTLSARLTRRVRELEDDERESIVKSTGGPDIAELSAGLLDSIDPDKVTATAVEQFRLPADTDPTDDQLDQVELGRMREH